MKLKEIEFKSNKFIQEIFNNVENSGVTTNNKFIHDFTNLFKSICPNIYNESNIDKIQARIYNSVFNLNGKLNNEVIELVDEIENFLEENEKKEIDVFYLFSKIVF